MTAPRAPEGPARKLVLVASMSIALAVLMALIGVRTGALLLGSMALLLLALALALRERGRPQG